MNSKVYAILAVVIVVAAGGAVAFTMLPHDGDNERELTDVCGNTFTVHGDVKKTFTTGWASTRYMSYLGDDAWKTIYAGTNIEDKPEKASYTAGKCYIYVMDTSEIEHVTLSGADLTTKIIADKPDIVLYSVSSKNLTNDDKDFIATLSGSNIPVCCVMYDSAFDDNFNSQMRLLGKIYGKEARAETLIDGIKSVYDDLSERASHATSKKTVYMGGVASKPYGLSATNASYNGILFFGDKVNYVPAELKGADAGLTQVAIDELLEYEKTHTIDVVFIDAWGYNYVKTGYTDNKALYGELACWNNDSVYVMPVTKSGGTSLDNMLIGTYFIGMTLFPEQFNDVVLKDKAVQIWNILTDGHGQACYDGIVSAIPDMMKQVTWIEA